MSEDEEPRQRMAVRNKEEGEAMQTIMMCEEELGTLCMAMGHTLNGVKVMRSGGNSGYSDDLISYGEGIGRIIDLYKNASETLKIARGEGSPEVQAQPTGSMTRKDLEARLADVHESHAPFWKQNHYICRVCKRALVGAVGASQVNVTVFGHDECMSG